MTERFDRRAVLALIGSAFPVLRRYRPRRLRSEVRAERERWTEYTRVAGIQPE
jgi:hypothetical protein